jgi:16S rRNA (guanine527-N7)-methyltransferase
LNSESHAVDGAEDPSATPATNASEDLVPEELAFRDAIAEVLRRCQLPERWSEPFARHARLVAETNRMLNLTRIVAPEEVAELQVEDSLGIGSRLPLAGARVLDLGTGAGYPGIPLAFLEPSAQVLLVDARRKKVEFLERVLAELGRGNLASRWGRAEQIIATEPRFDLVVARAVGSVASVLELLRPVRHQIGMVALAKGPRLESELEEARHLLKPSLFRLREVESYELRGAARNGEPLQRHVALFEPAGRAPKKGRPPGGGAPGTSGG